MSQANRKESAGFFSVLLGFGTSELKDETKPTDAKHPSGERRPAAPPQPVLRTKGPYEQPSSSVNAESRAPLRSSMAKDRSRSDAKRDNAAYAPEASGRNRSETLAERTRADERPSTLSARSPGHRRSQEPVEAQWPRDKHKFREQAVRKVVFNTPTHSLRKGQAGYSRPEEGGSSSDSSVPPRRPGPAPRSTKPKQMRAASKAEFEERNWNSSTATLQNKEEPRPRVNRNRSSRSGAYPLSKESQADGFQAVRGSGPDRVIISPIPTVEAEVPSPDTKFLPVSSTAPQRRPGPTPIAPTPRASQDLSRTRTRLAEPQRSKSHRDRQGHVRANSEAMPTREPSRSQSRPNKVDARRSMPARAMGPMPDLPPATLLSQNMARARAGERNAISAYQAPGLHHSYSMMPQERQSIARTRTQRA